MGTYIDNFLEVVCPEMLLRVKTAANRSFLEKGTVQPTVHSTAEPPSLAEVEIHPILCHDATIATCIPHISFPHPPPGRLLVGEVEGSIEGVCWGEGELPSHLEVCECDVCMCMCVTVSE